jgi:hypothetical protein
MNLSEVLSLYQHCRCRMLGAVYRSRQRQDRSFHFHDVPCASAMTRVGRFVTTHERFLPYLGMMKN